MTGNKKNKIDRVSPEFDRVDRVPGRPSGSTGFRRANSRAGFCLHPDRSQAWVGRVPGRPVGPVRVLKHWYFLGEKKLTSFVFFKIHPIIIISSKLSSDWTSCYFAKENNSRLVTSLLRLSNHINKGKKY